MWCSRAGTNTGNFAWCCSTCATLHNMCITVYNITPTCHGMKFIFSDHFQSINACGRNRDNWQCSILTYVKSVVTFVWGVFWHKPVKGVAVITATLCSESLHRAVSIVTVQWVSSVVTVQWISRLCSASRHCAVRLRAHCVLSDSALTIPSYYKPLYFSFIRNLNTMRTSNLYKCIC